MQTATTEQIAALFPLAASASVSETPHRGYRHPNTTLHQAIAYSKPLQPPGLRECLYDFRRRSRCTGKERDAETGLDYFGARYFSAAQGRWTSPDWSAIPVPVPYTSLGDPQTLNLYAYARNNPLGGADLDGHDGITCANHPELCAAIRDAVSSGGSIQDGYAAYAQGQQQQGQTGGDTAQQQQGQAAGGSFTSNFGIATKGQTFKGCMAANATRYSIGGFVEGTSDLIFHANTNYSETPIGSFLGGNALNALLFGSGGETAMETVHHSPDVVEKAMGESLSFGRRTADIMALNLAGKGGLPLALGRASGGAASLAGTVGKVLNLGMSFAMRVGIDVAFTGGEALNCSINGSN